MFILCETNSSCTETSRAGSGHIFAITRAGLQNVLRAGVGYQLLAYFQPVLRHGGLFSHPSLGSGSLQTTQKSARGPARPHHSLTCFLLLVQFLCQQNKKGVKDWPNWYYRPSSQLFMRGRIAALFRVGVGFLTKYKPNACRFLFGLPLKYVQSLNK